MDNSILSEIKLERSQEAMFLVQLQSQSDLLSGDVINETYIIAFYSSVPYTSLILHKEGAALPHT
jgi:hypothetical protein